LVEENEKPTELLEEILVVIELDCAPELEYLSRREKRNRTDHRDVVLTKHPQVTKKPTPIRMRRP